VIIKIEIDTREALSDEDKALLRAIGYMDDPGEAPAPAAAPTKKAAAKKAAAPSPEPETVSPEGVGHHGTSRRRGSPGV
jgi:hypothetical protein